MRLSPTLANSLWFATSLRERGAFLRAARDAASIVAAQEHLLLGNLRRNAGARYGREHGFDEVRSVEDYRQRVPLTDYEDYREHIRDIREGATGVLTREPVLLLEPTGGSSGSAQLIPYTASLKREFARGAAAWVSDLFLNDPHLLRGPAYWSVSPALRREERSPGGIPVGFETDAEYLGGSRSLASAVMAVPPEVGQIQDTGSFRYATLLYLLRSRSLALISVWNPTFLTLLLSPMPQWSESLTRDIECGTLSAPAPLDSNLTTRLEARLRPDPRRAAEVRGALALSPPEAHARLWPRLRLLSLWADAHAALQVPAAGRLFPQARVQGKGLIATECFVSLPLTGYSGTALALRSHFFEFLPEDSRSAPDAPTLLAHELEPGERYSVAVTTSGGLYRYRLGDVVEVADHIGSCPLLRFLGRSGVSDRYGEKLSERRAGAALRGAFADANLTPAFAMLAFEEEANAYTLFVEPATKPDTSGAALLDLAAGIEARLREDYHYDYCRRLGQLGPLRVFRTCPRAGDTYLEACRSLGQRPGDAKPVALHPAADWSTRLGGSFVEPPANPLATS